MSEIIRIKNSSYSYYEELLIRRDKLRKEAFVIHNSFIREFGDETLEVFQLKLECIRKKKMIAYCQKLINHGKSIDEAQLQAFLMQEMAEYEEQLNRMIEEQAAAEVSGTLSATEALEVRKIYRRLAKKVHPDINMMTEEDEELFDLWQRIVIAYNCNDLEMLRDLEVLVGSKLEALGDASCQMPNLENIEELIEKVQADITRIQETEPYTYKYLLNDEEKVRAKHSELADELQSYIEYEKQLDEILGGLMINGVNITWRMN